eukprot:TRINITY_DN636_c0_g1_i1.p1 TRINITY_DN636_c0_g1~~TRINITY_DN636_c0_g1_i1.p1  ORF type:complete len:154 (-),score=21.45 TRINITY_DN636_c0_g1_i1:119-580(-)
MGVLKEGARHFLRNFLYDLGWYLPYFKKGIDRSFHPTESMHALKKEMWNMRIELWLRRIRYLPESINLLKAELKCVVAKLQHPGTIKYGDIPVACYFAVQMWLFFKFGEIFGRRSFFGYDPRKSLSSRYPDCVYCGREQPHMPHSDFGGNFHG